MSRGIILRADADELIVQATPADVETFAKNIGKPVDVNVPMLTRDVNWHEVMSHGMLYDRHGNPIARIYNMEQFVTPFDVTHFGSFASTYIHGGRSVEIRARGL